MILYVYNGKDHKGMDGEALVARALADYSNHKYDAPIIKRGAHGKPSFENIPVCFSISHSGEIWVCLMADFNVGIDIQICKNVKYEKLAQRFFTDEEAEYIKEHEMNSFFEIWTRKEAYVKYTGDGFAKQGFSKFSLVDWNEGDCFLKPNLGDAYINVIDLPLDALNIRLESKLVGSVCTQARQDIIIKTL